MAIDIPCPHCGVRKIETVRHAWYIQGFLLLARFGSTRYIGCTSCTRRKVLGSMALTGVIGWWCFPWGLGTPLALTQNLIAAIGGPNRSALQAFLAEQGMELAEVELDDRGRASGQTRLLEAVVGVLHRMVWADGDADPREIEVGVTVAQTMLGDLFDPDEVSATLADPGAPAYDLGALPDDARLIVLRAAAAVAQADEVIDPGEIEAIRELGAEMGVSEAIVQSMIASLQADNEARGELDALKAVAADILGVAVDASAAEVQQQYRAMLLDAAGDEKDAEAAAERSERIAWAYHTLIA